MRAVIIDDERLAVLRLQQVLEQWEEVEVVGAFTRYAELLNEFPRLKPDVVFLDIDMPGMNGLELASVLLEMDEQVDIIFITAYDQYALEAFRVNAIDYLLKPIDEGILAKTLRRMTKRNARVPAIRREDTIRVRCFGDYLVSGLDGAGPVDFPTAKTEELFAFFLVHREMNVSKWMICEAMWPEHEPQKAEQNLHTTVYRMKKTLLESGCKVVLSSKKGFYHFKLDEPCDYIRFEESDKEAAGLQAATAIHAEQLEQTLRLYKGPLFGNKDYTWCEAAREQVSRSFIDRAKALARMYIKLEKRKQAHDLLQYLITLVPYEEEAHEMILRIYLQGGDRASFHNHYNKMKQTLQREVGVAPPAFMEELHQAMINKTL